MNARFIRHIASLFAVGVLAGCAAPGSGDVASYHQTTPTISMASARSNAPLAFDTNLSTVPADNANKSQSLSDAQPITDSPDVGTFEQKGKASWYGRWFHGRKTASGEKFDMNAMTAAHRTLPLASWVRVTNESNHKTVVVKINDRGPYVRGRVIDLSYAAAAALGMRGVGTQKVKIEGLTQQEARAAREQSQSLADDSVN
ncbi:MULTISPECIES: septal ring lytic transglycosylase RlpA family protein [unclassified Caballeronia]|uniref:septal ring lytic transglycosylase RlpA family protein n=1 Tax=unclassified Caballeronia TaxID=2646786 RepID=UPI00158873B7|nr:MULTISPECIES: septal ring lytic transglycosylase RlpA family protein [unclassified Caballeronia]QSN61324.1 septal ring lytic transglycosylase RlpA family protein [Caballeronia sp. M1242]